MLRAGRGLGRAGADRLPAPVRPGVRRRRARPCVAGELGWLHTVRSTTLDPAPPPEAYIAASGGIFRDCAVHDFDTVRWVTGREVVEVYAAGGNRGDADSSATRATRTRPRRCSPWTTARSPWCRTAGTTAAATTYASSCTAPLDAVAAGLDDTLPLRSADPDVKLPRPGRPPRSSWTVWPTAFRRELAAFTDVVAGELASPCTVADGLEASWVAEAATVSWRERRPVRVEEVRAS